MLKLTEHVGITIFLLYKQKPGEILIFRTFIVKFWIFAYITQNIAISRSGIIFMTSFLRNTLADCTHFGMYE